MISKQAWLILLSLAAILVMMNVLATGEKNGLNEVMKRGDIQIGENQIWVEVSLLTHSHEVTVRKGNKIVKKMPCSGGTKDEPTVMGVFYLENRGEWFYSQKYGEGAFYWVRFYEQYLFHSVPADQDRHVIKEEEAKIGKAASHGCIRLLEEDAKWFYDNVPDDTMVLIHD